MATVITPRGVFSPYRERTLPDGRVVYWKKVTPEQELSTPPGCAVDESVLADAAGRGFAGIRVLRVRTDEEVWAPLSRWRNGIPIRRGFGPQRALLWHQLEPLSGDDGRQLPLFEVAQ